MVKQSPPTANDHDSSLFDCAPVVMWQADAVGLQTWFDEMRAAGITEIRPLLESAPQKVLHGLALVKICRVNQASVAVFGARDEEHLLESAPQVMSTLPLSVLTDILAARWAGERYYRTEVQVTTLQGKPIHGVMAMSVPEESGQPDLSRAVITFTEITDRKQAEDALRESEERLRLAMQALQEREELLHLAEAAGRIGSFEYDMRTGLGRVSNELLSIYGMQPGEVEANRDAWLQRVHPDDWEQIAACVEAFSPANPQWRCEYRIFRPDGGLRWIEARGRTTFNGDGEPLRAAGVNLDITERKQAEEALRESEQFHRALLETLPVGVVLADAQGLVTYVSPRAQQDFDVPPGKGLGTTPLDWIAPEHHDVVRQRMRQVLVEGRPQPPMEYRMFKFDGTPVWAELASAPFFDGRGLVKGVITVCQDVTKRKRAEDSLREREERLRALADNLPHAMVYQMEERDGHPCFTYVSGNIEKFHEISPEAVLADVSALYRQVLPEYLPGLQAAEVSSYLTRSPFRYEMQCQLPSGKRRWVELVAAPRVLPDGHVVWDGVELDIAERKKADEALQSAKAAAEAASIAKSQFLANMSHELRTPMNAVLGMTDLALEEELSPAVRDYLQTARESADVLLELLNEILDLSRIEAGRFELESVHFSLRKTLEQVIKTLGMRAGEKGLELIGEMPGDVPDRLVGDPLRLRQVLMNLVGNAIKFTDQGTIVVGISRESPDTEEAVLRFSVADTGIGISPENRERIFSPFTQADPSTTRRFGGTGLGLAISRKLVELMQGRIWVESQVGRGSTFSFTARLKFQQGVPRETEAVGGSREPAALRSTPARALRVLVAEDTRANQKLVVHILTKRGHVVRSAFNGQQALDLLERQAFDVVLMDVQMPVMDGFQATQAIRSLPDARKARVPILAMTAHALKGDEERCLAAGMDGYLSKPVKGQELIEVVERTAEQPACPHAAHAARAVEESSCSAAGVAAAPVRVPTAVFDLEDAVKHCYGKYSLFQDMAQCLFDEAEPLLERLRTALAGGNAKQLANLAHALKSTVGYLGAEPAMEATRRVERIARCGDLAGAAEAVEQLEQQLSILKQALAPHQRAGAS